MSISKMVRRPMGVLKVKQSLSQHSDVVSFRRTLAAFGTMVLGGLLASCEQQVASAEQSPGVSEKRATAPLEPSSGNPQESSGKGKLVFDKLACQLPNRGGEVTDGCSVIAHVGLERQGHLTYGPYVPLAPGDYLFELEYRSSGDATAGAGRWDASARLGPDEEVVAKGEIAGTGNSPGLLVGRFSMPRKDGVPVLEIRTSPALAAETEIKRLRIYEATGT